MLFPVLYLSSRFYYKQGPVPADEIDLVTGIKEVEQET